MSDDRPPTCHARVWREKGGYRQWIGMCWEPGCGSIRCNSEEIAELHMTKTCTALRPEAS